MFAAEGVSYNKTNSFTKIVLDYLEGSAALEPFYQFTADAKGIEEAIRAKKSQPVNRSVLVEVLKNQYAGLPPSDRVKTNISALLSEQTFTICTAHQPNLFTGPLYFIYKILHAIKLAAYLSEQYPEYRFVPVYYMGSEDADLEELNHFHVDGKRYEWSTTQKGAVGRMLVDAKLLLLIDDLYQQIGITEEGRTFVHLLRECYTTDSSIQLATLRLVHSLFQSYGLVVLLPDDARLKSQMIPHFLDELFENTSSQLVASTSQQIGALYNAQAHSRNINLFYLLDGMRERLEHTEGIFRVLNSSFTFTAEEMRREVADHPERFSPNVILRGLYQESILPNVAFIGGGGELAYWLQLSALFEAKKVVFPVLLLRNSFLIVDERRKQLSVKMSLLSEQYFLPENDLLNAIIAKEGKEPKLNGELEKVSALYDSLMEKVSLITPALQTHMAALKTKAVNGLLEAEKKMQRAERRRWVDTKAQITTLKEGLFPTGNLQERVENIALFYTKWGSGFIPALYENAPPFTKDLVVLTKVSEA